MSREEFLVVLMAIMFFFGGLAFIVWAIETAAKRWMR